MAHEPKPANPQPINLPKLIARHLRAVADLEKLYPGRKFTPDGHLVGSIGEVIAAKHFGCPVTMPSTPTERGTIPGGWISGYRRRAFSHQSRERTMKFGFFAFLAFLGGAMFLLSFVADRQAKLGDDRVARKMSHSVIDARLASERSPYLRTER